MHRTFWLPVTIVGMLVVAPSARANWGSDPAVNLAVCTADLDQNLAFLLPDGFGGAWIAWSDQRVSPTQADIYVQHVLTAGVLDPQFPAQGLLVCSSPSQQLAPVLALDGDTGVLVAWFDQRVAAGNPDIYIHHVLINGTVDPTWPANGAGVETSITFQNFPKMISDGAGGAFLCFQSTTFGSLNIYAQHMLANGTQDPAWPGGEGLPVSVTVGSQRAPQLVSDGSTGLIVAWEDERSGPADVYATHVLGNGTLDPAYPLNGRTICTASGIQEQVGLISDGAGGALLVWRDQRASVVGDIYGHHLRADGSLDPAWPALGAPICSAAGEQIQPVIVTDGAHGAIVAWRDARAGNLDIYSHHILADSQLDPSWPAAGAALCSSPGDQTMSSRNLVSDGAGGALAVWRDARPGAKVNDVYAGHVLSSGLLDPAWPVNGRAVCLADSDQSVPSACSDGTGGLLVSWSDKRAPSWDLYMQRVAANGTLPVVSVAGASSGIRRLEPPLPNPAMESALLRFSLPASEYLSLEVLDVSGRAIRRLADGRFAPGTHQFRWDLRDESGRAVPEGVYLERLVTSGRTEAARIVVLRRGHP